MPFKLAVMVMVPRLTRTASPHFPSKLLMMTTRLLLEDQCTWAVMSCVLPSLKCPVALNCRLGVSRLTTAFTGVTEMDTRIALVAVSVTVPDMDPSWAVSVIGPRAIAVATPEGLTAMPAELAELQVTEAVRSWVVPSLKWPMAVNCSDVPRAKERELQL